MKTWLPFAAVWLCAFLFFTDVSGQASPAQGWGVDPSNIDRGVAPCTDFYGYAVGGWLKRTTIPAEYSHWGQFNVIVDRNEAILHRIVDQDAGAHAAAGSNPQKVGDFYASGMDEAAIERAGMAPLAPYMARINALSSMQQAGALIADLQQDGNSVIFHLGAGPDAKNSALVIAAAGQGGLILPGPDYYTQTDAASVKLRGQYTDYLVKLFVLAGDAPELAKTEAQQVLDIETSLANGSSTRVQLRDPVANYHRQTVEGLEKMVPHFEWAAYTKTLGLTSATPLNVGQPRFFEQLDKSLVSAPLAAWKAYLRVHLIDSMAPALSANFEDAHFAFHSTTLSGTPKNLPRWKRVLHVIDGEIGEALGQEYVKVAFPPASKARALALVNNLRAALRDDIGRIDWMGPETKKQALAKLASMREKIGYPDRWRDYSALTITRNSYAQNIFHAERFDFRRRLAQIGHAPDRGEWHMTPSTVNAYYNPSMNEIVFPAGILQPPFFDATADDAVNYGGIGAVIGHEMTHGFDDKGSQYDAQGNLRMWWTKEDLARFQARATCVEDQFEAMEAEPGLHVQGKLVKGESIADLGGLTIAYMAYQKSLEGKPAPPVIDGFTAAQRFFLSYGQIWASVERPEYVRLLTKTNPHPLPRLRVNGTVANMPAFWKAFGCKEGEPMERTGDKHCEIW